MYTVQDVANACARSDGKPFRLSTDAKYALDKDVPRMAETIASLARELGAAHHVLDQMGCAINVTKPELKEWIEWGKNFIREQATK